MITNNNKIKYNIIVPIYRELILSEKISIKALFRHMKGKCDIWFILPDTDDTIRNSLILFLNDFLGCEITKDFYIKEMNKKWFESKHSYSSLLLTSEFYDFWYKLGYDKSFIYQTDCYLFRDEFDYWADKNYTFVGAPIIATNSDWGYYGGYVGNGGFSMRDNKTLSIILNRENKLWKKYKKQFENTYLEKHTTEKYIDYEDIFICRLLSKYVYINLPSARQAAKFAYDRNPTECSDLYCIDCPMCAHNFMLLSSYWKKYIPELNEKNQKFNKELAKTAKNIVSNWKQIDHPEEHGRQCASED